MSSLHDRVMAALEQVIDPCSVTARAPISVVDMGMLTDLRVEDSGQVHIGLRATSAMCTMIAGIAKVTEDTVGALEGVTRVEVVLSGGGPVWTEQAMTEKGRSILNARRQLSRNEMQVKPHEWKTRRHATAS